MKVTFDPCDEIWNFSDYDSFYACVVEREEGDININLSYAEVNGRRVKIGGDLTHNAVLIRKKEHDRLKLEYPDEQFNWWTQDGLYYKGKNIFPGAVLRLYYKKPSNTD